MKTGKNDWNPAAYLAFNTERTQPAIDLVQRLGAMEPQTIIDIGCGPGNSTSVLKNRWQRASILGIDNSPSMIEKAKKTYPDQQWEVRDIADVDSRSYDLVFSNAVIQWIPDHERLIKKLVSITSPEGTVAIQMPLFNQMAISGIIDKTYHSLFPNNDFDIDDVFTFHASEYYYELCSRFSHDVEIWETDYYHIMDSDAAIFNMVETTGIKPYMDTLRRAEDKELFSQSINECLSGKYYHAENRKVLFPFKRMFVIMRMIA